jgi:hypothetical protein
MIRLPHARQRSDSNPAVDRAPAPIARSLVIALACVTTMTINAGAQTLPSEPITFGGGRITLGGDVAASFGAEDPSFFTYGEYKHSTLRQVRLGLNGEVRASRRLSLLAEIRSENLDDISPFALYARIRPFPEHRLDVQLGRIPPTFGRFSRQAYSRDNILIGYPLGYQYLTSLRPDALPANADELLAMRGRGWESAFSVGDTVPRPGVPLVDALRWDTGIQVTGGWRAVSLTGAVTNGTVSNPRVDDDNSGKQVAARAVVAAAPGIEAGYSVARGAFVSRAPLTALGASSGSGFVQLAHGIDVEYARGHWLARTEAVATEWRVPVGSADRVETLRALAWSAEARYVLAPGLHLAGRADYLTFNRIAGAALPQAWDAPVTRVELGASYYLQRNLILRGSLQFNHREGIRDTSARLPAVQLLYWF